MAANTAKPMAALKWFGIMAAILIVGSILYGIIADAWTSSSPSHGSAPAPTGSKASVPGGNKGGWVTISAQGASNCVIDWNVEEAGVWCKAIYLPAGTYRIREKFTGTWNHWDIGADGKLSVFGIPAKGIPVQETWNPSTDFYQEFVQDAPIPSMPFGRLIALVDTTTKYSQWSHSSFSIYGTERVKVLIGLNIPPVKQYIALDRGQPIPFEIQKWVE